jgi:hypothetical protein
MNGEDFVPHHNVPGLARLELEAADTSAIYKQILNYSRLCDRT